MKLLRLLAAALAVLPITPALANDDYKLGPDSQPRTDVPHGTVTHGTITGKVYPGAAHDYWIYVPAQYDASKPACLMVFLDGGGFADVNGQFRVPVVFDNLIAAKQMPVTIAVMVNPGVVPAANPNALPRFNRSVEYDTPNGVFDRFLENELLPFVAQKYKFSTEPNDRAICGASSGGICAFTVAWERPDLFRRVITYVGSFTDLHGGNVYPSMIRKTEPKPLRVFMQDGSHDQDIYSGSWFIGNTDVAAALKFAGCDYQFVVGDGGHNGKQGGAILPDALRWIWRDYPAPIVPASHTAQPIMDVLMPGSGWLMFASPLRHVGGLTTNAGGLVLYSLHGSEVDIRSRPIPMHGEPFHVALFKTESPFTFGDDATGIACGPNNTIFACEPKHKSVVQYDQSGKRLRVISGVVADRIVVSSRGDAYFVERRTGAIWLAQAKGGKRKVDDGVPEARGITFSPDQTLLYVATDSVGSGAYSFSILPDGSLMNKQVFYDLQVPYGQATNGVGDIATDDQGRLYAATTAGIQVCDQAGRVIGIICSPSLEPVTSITFGGADRSVLYAATRNAVYSRNVKARGVAPFLPPVKPPPPHL